MTLYSVTDYVRDIREIFYRETEIGRIVERIKPLALRLAQDPNWFHERYRRTDPDQGVGLHLLHEEDNHDLAVFAIAWAPGLGVPPHNHKTWAVVAGIEGQEHETTYRRLDDGSAPGFAELEATHAETLYPGTAVCCMPDDIHSVFNNGDRVAVSLHTYGRHLNHTGRSTFDVEAKTETPLILKVER
ncbi:hypothetical protein HKCCE3408_18670 [Rhodobacterales bacterium HKCCE3408]|nr:hypothetical protein [Rhodobacterales bacterium HKCCE3408]